MRYSSYFLPVALVVVILLVLYSVITGRALEYSQPRSPTPAAVPVGADVDVSAMGQDTGWRPKVVTVPGVDVAAVPPACLMVVDSEGSYDERPIHPACFDRPVWLDRYAGMKEQFEEFGGQSGRGTAWAEMDRFDEEPDFDYGGSDYRRAPAYE